MHQQAGAELERAQKASAAAAAELASAEGEDGRKALVRRLAADVIRQAREGVGS